MSPRKAYVLMFVGVAFCVAGSWIGHGPLAVTFAVAAVAVTGYTATRWLTDDTPANRDARTVADFDRRFRP